MTQMLELAGKDLKTAIITMLKDVKENMIVMNKQIVNLSSGREQ